MARIYSAQHLDIASFANAAGHLKGQAALHGFERLAREAQADITDLQFQWSAVGAQKNNAIGSPENWLYLHVETHLPRVCQRCLEVAQIPLLVNRAFRFVQSEEVAMEQDEQCDEDLLVLQPDFNLFELIEDELLMEIPSIAKHETCPKAVKMATKDADFADDPGEKHHPFALLARLQDNKPS